MGYILNTKLLCILIEPSPVTNEEMQNAYVDFVEQVTTISRSETDYSKIYRLLNLTRIELVFNQYGQEKKCPKGSILTEGYSTSRIRNRFAETYISASQPIFRQYAIR